MISQNVRLSDSKTVLAGEIPLGTMIKPVMDS